MLTLFAGVMLISFAGEGSLCSLGIAHFIRWGNAHFIRFLRKAQILDGEYYGEGGSFLGD